jgi:hypothetical protein
MASPVPSAATPLARQARELFVVHMQGVLPELSDSVRNVLADQMNTAQSSREMQQRRDALVEFEQSSARWVDAVARAWRRAVVPPAAPARVRVELASLELIGDDVVENKILSSRLAMAIQEKAVWELNDLKLRIVHIEGGEELGPEDVLRPEALAQVMLDEWALAKLSRETWASVKDVIQGLVVPRALQGYQQANEFLVENGVLENIDLRSRVKRPAAGPTSAPRPPEGGGGGSGGGGSEGSGSGGSGNGGSGNGGSGGDGSGGGRSGNGGSGNGGSAGGGGGRTAGASTMSGGGAGGGFAGSGFAGSAFAGAPGTGSRSGTAGNGAESFFSPAQAMTGAGGSEGATPLARARARANGVLGQLKKLLRDKVGMPDNPDGTPGVPPSASLVAAVTHHATQVQTQVQTRVNEAMTVGDIVVFDDDAVEQVALDLRNRSLDLKKKASSTNEKATIEIVALMFQSILAEERIPPAVRVWFARLQMPVLRVALAEPEFFGSLEHPARQLIDRMGSCVLGFDASAISGSALETEIRRVVQVIEQYPETGRRVFQLVYDEFHRFLSRFLTEKGPTQKLVSVAQQVEQKETMAIQYTIELRKMLSDVPVRDEIREFLFKVWAEVLAVAGVKNGPQHEETLALKKSASDLVWAASAKPNRHDRAKVIQDLPDLLARLRRGMSLLGLDPTEQENHIKVIGDTLADAFLSKTEAIPHARIEEMTKRLANLEDFVSDDDAGELPLDQESIEMMLGIDASMIEVIGSGGSQPNAANMAWANEIQVGTWFTLDHNGRMNQVQYVWCSDRRQLHLFASGEGYCFLMPVRRLAAYLQANLLVPTEEEALTVRATRDALAKLDANPERLLS